MKKIMILGESYKLIYKKGLSEREGLEGYADPHRYEIVIDSSFLEKGKERAHAKVFWHEVGHAYAFESGVHEFLGADAREMFAQTFSVFMCSLKIKKP